MKCDVLFDTVYCPNGRGIAWERRREWREEWHRSRGWGEVGVTAPTL